MLSPSPGDSLVGPPASAPAHDLRRRVSRLLLLRTLVVTVVLGLSRWVLEPTKAPSPAAVWLQSGIIAATYLSSIAFGVLLRRGAAPEQVAFPMQASDLAVTSLLVYLTGGPTSPYTFLYALSIVSAGALGYLRGAVIVTIAALLAVTLTSLAA